MTDVIDFPSGQFRFVRGVAPYSAVVTPIVGFEIERARFAHLVVLEEGFAQRRIWGVSGGRSWPGLADRAACLCVGCPLHTSRSHRPGRHPSLPSDTPGLPHTNSILAVRGDRFSGS